MEKNKIFEKKKKNIQKKIVANISLLILYYVCNYFVTWLFFQYGKKVTFPSIKGWNIGKLY